jgi:hypothetical protein
LGRYVIGLLSHYTNRGTAVPCRALSVSSFNSFSLFCQTVRCDRSSSQECHSYLPGSAKTVNVLSSAVPHPIRKAAKINATNGATRMGRITRPVWTAAKLKLASKA